MTNGILYVNRDRRLKADSSLSTFVTRIQILLAETGIQGVLCVNWEDGDDIKHIVKHIHRQQLLGKGGAEFHLKNQRQIS